MKKKQNKCKLNWIVQIVTQNHTTTACNASTLGIFMLMKFRTMMKHR